MRPTLGAVLAVALVAFSACSSATPLDLNRPALPTAIASGQCWPLPHGSRFDFPVQELDDVQVGTSRRLLTLQFDRVGAATAQTSARGALTNGGFTPATPPPYADAGSGLTWYHRRGWGYVGMAIAALPDLPSDSLVRGTLVLNLPERTWHPRPARGCTPPRLPASGEAARNASPGATS